MYWCSGAVMQRCSKYSGAVSVVMYWCSGAVMQRCSKYSGAVSVVVQ